MNNHTVNRLRYMTIGALFFSMVPLLLSYTYFRFFDNTDYYTVIQPVPVAQEWYKPCDEVVLTLTRTAQFDLNGVVVTDLLLKQDNEVVFKVSTANFKRDISIKKGADVTVATSYPLPCNLANGLYYWQLTFDYRVKGFEHQYTAISNTFNVNELGIDPEVIKKATESAKLTPGPVVRNPAVRQPTATPVPQAQANEPSGGSTTIINNNTSPNNSSPQPTSQPQNTPTPQPTPSNGIVCNLLGICL